jgi:hypothetical protein
VNLQTPFGGFSSIEEYLDYLWFTMHHTDDPNRQAWVFDVRCYLDESGTHDQSPYTVVAGLLLNRNNFISLGREWQKMLCERGVKVPIHMKEFGRPDGKLAYLTDSDRYLLFANIAGIVNSHKIYSVAATLDQQQYREILKLNKRKEMSPHGLCFIHCVVTNYVNAKDNKYKHNIAYLLSEVSEHKGQILISHAAIRREQEEKSIPYRVGSISFDLPKYVPALQAADVIAWGVRRRLIGDSFDQGFDYIENIISESHVEETWKRTDLQGVVKRLMKYKDQPH